MWVLAIRIEIKSSRWIREFVNHNNHWFSTFPNKPSLNSLEFHHCRSKVLPSHTQFWKNSMPEKEWPPPPNTVVNAPWMAEVLSYRSSVSLFEPPSSRHEPPKMCALFFSRSWLLVDDALPLSSVATVAAADPVVELWRSNLGQMLYVQWHSF